MDSHYLRLFSAPILHYKHHCLETSLPRHGKFSVIGSSISLSWRLQRTGLLAGYRGTLGSHRCALEVLLHPQELDLTHLPAPQPERVGAKCHSNKLGLSHQLEAQTLGACCCLVRVTPSEEPAWKPHQLWNCLALQMALWCLSRRKEMTTEGQTSQGYSMGELKYSLRDRLCGTGL